MEGECAEAEESPIFGHYTRNVSTVDRFRAGIGRDQPAILLGTCESHFRSILPMQSAAEIRNLTPIEADDELSNQSDSRTLTSTKLSFNMKMRGLFFDRVAAKLGTSLPLELKTFSSKPAFNLMKIAYENDRVHFEVAFDVTRETMEIALHFEDGPVSTAAYLLYFDRRIVELKDHLGPEIDLERWTMSWGRIYEIWPLETLDREVADRAAARLHEYITVLQPLLYAASIAPERSSLSEGIKRDRWRGAAKKR